MSDINLILSPLGRLTEAEAEIIALRHLDRREKIIVRDADNKEFRFLKSDLKVKK